MKFVNCFLLLFVLIACSKTNDYSGVYYNDFGEELVLFSNNKYKYHSSIKTFNGNWKVVSNGDLLLNNWIDENGQIYDVMITSNNDVLWFEPDNESKNFKKIR